MVLPLASWHLSFPVMHVRMRVQMQRAAGMGGYVRLPDGRELGFQHTLSPSALASAFPWFPSNANPQHYVASGELAAQRCFSVRSACWALATCQLMLSSEQITALRSLPAGRVCPWLRAWVCYCAHLFSCSANKTFPSTLIAQCHLDRLGRGSPPDAMGFAPDQLCSGSDGCIPWSSFPTMSVLTHFPTDSPMPSFL